MILGCQQRSGSIIHHAYAADRDGLHTAHRPAVLMSEASALGLLARSIRPTPPTNLHQLAQHQCDNDANNGSNSTMII